MVFHYLFQCTAVIDIAVVALFLIDYFTSLGVEDGGDMGLDGVGAVVAVGFEGCENFVEAALTFAGEGVALWFSVAFKWVEAVFDMNMRDVCFDCLVELKGILPWVGLGFGAVTLKGGVASVKDEFEPRHFVDQS